MKKFLSIFLLISIGLFFCNAGIAKNNKKKETEKSDIIPFEYTTSDNYIVNSFLEYPLNKSDAYHLVVLLHSYGTDSNAWSDLGDKLKEAGFTVLKIDFRGHGKSKYLSNLKQRSWLFLPPSAINDLPNDVLEIISKLSQLYPEISKKGISFVGADLGASVAIITASMLVEQPEAMVLITPLMNFKGLYIPIKLADSGKYPILALNGAKDRYSLGQMFEVKKYAQGTFDVKTYQVGGPGINILSKNPKSSVFITNWLVEKITD